MSFTYEPYHRHPYPVSVIAIKNYINYDDAEALSKMVPCAYIDAVDNKLKVSTKEGPKVVTNGSFIVQKSAYDFDVLNEQELDNKFLKGPAK